MMKRRELLKAGLAGAATLLRAQNKRAPRKIIIVGAGITGLSCAYELMKLGHEVSVIEASNRTGGHVRTLRDPFADGLYAEVGAEHFNLPEYIHYARYVKEFGLIAIPHPVRKNRLRFLPDGRFTEEDLQRKSVLEGIGFNSRECDFLKNHTWVELPVLYLQRYAEQIRDEADPFRNNLGKLDELTVAALLKRDNASAAALKYFGNGNSALHAVWGLALKKMRGADFENRNLFRIQGGNEGMTSAFAERLGNRIRLNCPVTRIEHGGTGVTITYLESGELRKASADFLVSAISLVGLRQIPITPAWSEAKAHVVQEMPYTIKSRVAYQSKTRFWKTEGISPNWAVHDPRIPEIWAIAEEVNTPRGMLVANSLVGISAAAASAAHAKYYPGKNADIDRVVVHDWGKDKWAGMCERGSYQPGQLSRFWPEAKRAFGRIHFAGAYAAPMSWGQEAALESANRVAREIDAA